MMNTAKKHIKRFKPIWMLFVPNFTTIVLIWVLLAALMLRNEINCFIAEHVGNQATILYDLLSTRPGFNWAITIFLLICARYSIRRILKSKNYSWLVIGSLFVFIYLSWDTYWVWAKLPVIGNYRCLFLFICLIFIGSGCWLLLKTVKSLSLGLADKIGFSGFSVKTDKDAMQDTGWEKYAETLVEKLINTNTHDESFAVGVTGNWGSGKTTFLKMIETKLKNQAYLLNFNPWNSDTAAQISADFFRTLISGLPISSYQGRPIAQYAKLLEQMNVFGGHTKMVTSLIDVFTPIKDAKESASEVVEAMPRPVVVLIDDLDRLSGAEMMAVLRLVCVTANFKNLIFIVAYDKEYVSQTIKGNGEKNGDEFLKKIFPLEVCLPKFESFILANHLCYELGNCLCESILKQLKFWIREGTASHPISYYIPTFRDVKRFANQFSLNISSFIKSNQINEIDVVDFFMLELLHYYDSEAYQQIRNRPLSLLDYGYDINKKSAFSYRKVGSIKGDKKIEYKDAERAQLLARFKDGVPDLLWVLFGSTAVRGDSHLRYPTNFTKYFSYRINKNAIGLEEFKQFLALDSEEAISARVKDYCLGDVSRVKALRLHLTSLRIDITDERQAFNASYALLELAYYKGIDPGSTFKVMFDKARYKDVGVVPGALMDAIRAHIKKYGGRRYIQEILTALVEYDVIISGAENGYYVQYMSILDKEQLIKLSGENIASAIENREIPPIQEITDKNSNFHVFLSSAVAIVASEYVDDEVEEQYGRSLLIDKLCEYYASQDNEAGIKQFFGNLNPPEDIFNSLDEDYSYHLRGNISKVFGSVNHYQDFYTFIEKAFRDQIDEVNAQLKRWEMKEIAVKSSETKAN